MRHIDVLKILENAKGEYVSGQTLADTFGISRQAVNKAVQTLCAKGYDISCVQGRGYCLEQSCDLLSSQVIAAETGIPVYYKKTTPSTNLLAAEKYLESGECIAIASRQSEGKRKDGGTFASPEDSGIYLSFAFPFREKTERVGDFRELFAKAVEGILKDYGNVQRVRTDEFYIGEKKTAGILTECMVNTALNETNFLVVGIGVYTRRFSDEFAPIDADSKNRLILRLYRALLDTRREFIK